MFKYIKNNALFSISLVAFFFPTTTNGLLTNKYVTLFTILLEVVLLLLLCFGKLSISLIQAFFSFLIIVSLLYATLTTPFIEFKFGQMKYYLMFATLMSINFKKSKYSFSNNIVSFRIFAILVNILGLGTILHVKPINDFIYQFYGAHYQELVPMMIASGKPVLTYATHSVAGLAIFLFFLISFYTYKKLNNVIDLFFAISFCILLVNLKSFTAIMYLVVAIGMLLLLLPWKQLRFVWGTAVVIVLYFSIFKVDIVMELLKNLSYVLFEKQNNGLEGRYSNAGSLTGNIGFIKENLLRPVGFGSSDNVTFVDSGYIEYMLRGSLPLVFGMFGGLAIFLKNNLSNKIEFLIIFLTFLAFEVGYAGFLQPKIIFFLPFMVTYLEYLNNLEDGLEISILRNN